MIARRTTCGGSNSCWTVPVARLHQGPREPVHVREHHALRAAGVVPWRSAGEDFPRALAARDGRRTPANGKKQVLDSGDAMVTEETTLEPDGTHVFLTNKYPIFDEEGSVVAVDDVGRHQPPQVRGVRGAGGADTARHGTREHDGRGLHHGRRGTADGLQSGLRAVPQVRKQEATAWTRSTGSPSCSTSSAKSTQDEWPVPRALRGETGPRRRVRRAAQGHRRDLGRDLRLRSLRNAAGDITGTKAVGRDVTAERRGEQRLAQLEQLIEAQAALAKSEEQLALVAEHITDVIWTMDLDTMHVNLLRPLGGATAGIHAG